jgi:hypothetical protein
MLTFSGPEEKAEARARKFVQLDPSNFQVPTAVAEVAVVPVGVVPVIEYQVLPPSPETSNCTVAEKLLPEGPSVIEAAPTLGGIASDTHAPLVEGPFAGVQLEAEAVMLLLAFGICASEKTEANKMARQSFFMECPW